MPIFEYRCQDCGTKFEKLLRRAADNAELACPSCGKNHLEQELSTFAAHSNSKPKASEAPMCPGGGPCRNPELCGMS